MSPMDVPTATARLATADSEAFGTLVDALEHAADHETVPADVRDSGIVFARSYALARVEPIIGLCRDALEELGQ